MKAAEVAGVEVSIDGLSRWLQAGHLQLLVQDGFSDL